MYRKLRVVVDFSVAVVFGMTTVLFLSVGSETTNTAVLDPAPGTAKAERTGRQPIPPAPAAQGASR